MTSQFHYIRKNQLPSSIECHVKVIFAHVDVSLISLLLTKCKLIMRVTFFHAQLPNIDCLSMKATVVKYTHLYYYLDKTNILKTYLVF